MRWSSVILAAGFVISLGSHARVAEPRPARPVSSELAEQRYRIIGRLHFALFSVGSDEVGSARISIRSDGEGSWMSLLAGSDPDRAPKRLNEWAYVREEIGPHSAGVFMLRPADADDAPPADIVARRDAPRFAAQCASLTDRDVRSFATVISGQQTMSFRTFERLLQQLAEAPPKWQSEYFVRPPGVQPGFLTALQLMLHATSTADAGRSIAAVPYVYNGKVYELFVRKMQTLGRTVVGTHAFEALTRADLAVRNRSTGDVTKFAVTFVPGGSRVCLPVQIFYHPSFWVSVELRQDEAVDAPPDPAVVDGTLAQIRRICANAAH